MNIHCGLIQYQTGANHRPNAFASIVNSCLNGQVCAANTTENSKHWVNFVSVTQHRYPPVDVAVILSRSSMQAELTKCMFLLHRLTIL
jgi:hypothetical protein